MQKLESDLNIQILDRSGHRARFTRTGQLLLEKGREILHSVRELEKPGDQTPAGLGTRTYHRRRQRLSLFPADAVNRGVLSKLQRHAAKIYQRCAWRLVGSAHGRAGGHYCRGDERAAFAERFRLYAAGPGWRSSLLWRPTIHWRKPRNRCRAV